MTTKTTIKTTKYIVHGFNFRTRKLGQFTYQKKESAIKAAREWLANYEEAVENNPEFAKYRHHAEDFYIEKKVTITEYIDF